MHKTSSGRMAKRYGQELEVRAGAEDPSTRGRARAVAHAPPGGLHRGILGSTQAGFRMMRTGRCDWPPTMPEGGVLVLAKDRDTALVGQGD